MKNIIYFLAAGLGFFILLTSGIGSSSGSPGGKTGSPGDGTTCTECHIGNVNPAEGWITSDIPATGYMPGETYTITATGTHTGVVRFGFEVTSEDNNNNKVGAYTITNSTETQLTNSNHAVTHKFAGTTPSNNMKTWTFDWTAPSTGTGDVTFYGAFNAANGNGNNSGDVIYNTSYSVMEHIVGVNDIAENNADVQLYPNPFVDYINVSLSNDENQIETVKVLDQSGRLIRQIPVGFENDQLRLDASDLKSGLYLIVIETSGRQSISKSIVKL